ICITSADVSPKSSSLGEGTTKQTKKGAEKRLGYITFVPSLHTSLLSGKKSTTHLYTHTQKLFGFTLNTKGLDR
ncbi:uncharacterized protein B0T23DRAFT_362104, partial [Neurospora hispaniola]